METNMLNMDTNILDGYKTMNGTIPTYPTGALILSITSCSFSVVGGFVIFATYFMIPEIRNVTRKLMLCLTVADILTAGGYLVSGIKYSLIGNNTYRSSTDHDVCEIQGGITTYSSLVSFFFTVIIAAHILATVINRRNNTTVTWLVAFNIISWGIPGIIITLALVQRVIGEDTSKAAGTGPWCWIKSGVLHEHFWMWVTGKGWEIACYLLTTTLYMTLKFYMYRRHYNERFEQIQCSLRDEDKNFLYVWLVLYIIRIWGTLRFFLFVYMKNPPQQLMNVLLYLQALGDPAQAFCNFFLFCVLDTTVRGKLCSVFNRGDRSDGNRETEHLVDEFAPRGGVSVNAIVSRSCDVSRNRGRQLEYGAMRGGISARKSYSTGSVSHWEAMRATAGHEDEVA